jgi:hypothetical protein
VTRRGAIIGALVAAALTVLAGAFEIWIVLVLAAPFAWLVLGDAARPDWQEMVVLLAIAVPINAAVGALFGGLVGRMRSRA